MLWRGLDMSQAVVIWVAPNGGSVNGIHVMEVSDAASKALDIVASLSESVEMSAGDIVDTLNTDGYAVILSEPDNRIEVWMAVP